MTFQRYDIDQFGAAQAQGDDVAQGKLRADAQDNAARVPAGIGGGVAILRADVCRLAMI